MPKIYRISPPAQYVTQHSLTILSPPALSTAPPTRLATPPKPSLQEEDLADTIFASPPAKSRPLRYRLDGLPNQRLRLPLQRQQLHQRSPSRSRETVLAG